MCQVWLTSWEDFKMMSVNLSDYITLLFPLENERSSFLKIDLNPFYSWILVPSLAEINPVVLEKNINFEKFTDKRIADTELKFVQKMNSFFRTNFNRTW